MTEIVEQHGANHVFPKTIPEKRNNRDVTVKVVLGSVFATVGFMLAKGKVYFLVTSVSYLFLLFVFIQACFRICYLYEESFHLKSRYEENMWKMLKETFSFDNNDNNNKIAIAVSICSLFVMGNPLESIQSDGIIPWILMFIGMKFFVSIMKLEECSLNTAKLMDDLKGLDYGSGMAYSFFYGYLNLILPCTGDERKGLKEQIKDYESKHQVEFGSKKLYIFIPLSAYCPTSIVQYSNCMEASGSLDWRRMDRAGVKERQYHNSVYKLWSDRLKKPIYVCAEFATPLLTLHEVMSQNNDESRRYKKYQKEIVTNFYLTLHKIIKTNRDCRDLAELIYYRDVDNDGNPLDRNNLDVGQLLLERINRDKTNNP